MNQSKNSYIMFLLGLFSQTHIHIVGSIAISEFVMFIIAPFVFVANSSILKRERIAPTLFLLVLAMVGCVLSGIHNHTPIVTFLKGFASPYGFFAGVVVFYVVLRKFPSSFKWYLLGSAISYVICTFVFQQDFEYVEAYNRYGDISEGIMSGSIYWIGRLNGFVMWPIQGLYLQCPLTYSVLGTLVFGFWSILTSTSGRSMALMSILSATIIYIGGKSPRKMASVQKHFFLMLLVIAVVGISFKNAYSYAASAGLLGYDAQMKYEVQTRQGRGALSLIRAGRGDVFAGAYVCSKNPFWGYGPWALDWNGLYAEYLRKYGDVVEYEKRVEYDARMLSGSDKVRLLPAHSAIFGWWLWYGVLALPIWFYILYLIYDVLRHRMSAIPEFFGYFACGIPNMLWGLFFSPFGQRLPWAFFVAMLLLARKVSHDQRNMQNLIMTRSAF